MDLLLQFMEDFGYTAMFLIMVLENANVPIPSEIVLGFSGYLVSQSVFSFWPAVIVGTLAGVAGSILSYWLGMYGGRPFLRRYGKYFFFSETKFHAAETLFLRYGGIAVFTGRLLPGIRTFISFPAGVARYPMGKFIFYTALGTVPWTVLLIWLGNLLGAHWEDIIAYNHDFTLAIGAAFLMGLAVFGWKWKKARTAQRGIISE